MELGVQLSGRALTSHFSCGFYPYQGYSNTKRAAERQDVESTPLPPQLAYSDVRDRGKAVGEPGGSL